MILKKPFPTSYNTPLQSSNDVALYLWNKENQAIAALHLDTLLSLANEELRNALDTLLFNPNWLVASNGFHWRSEIPGRLWETYHQDTIKLEPATRQKIETIFFAWMKHELQGTLSDTARLWAYLGSENHHIMRVYTNWQGTKILSQTAYKDTIIDGYTIEQHYQMLNLYIKLLLKERNLKGGFLEHGSHTYSKYTLQCIYNFHDFGDAELTHNAKAILDTWWADFGQEQIDFVRGGSKNRIYQHLTTNDVSNGSYPMIWAYTGGGLKAHRHPVYTSLYSSSYRLPKSGFRYYS